MLHLVEKRDHSEVPFDAVRIENAIFAAARSLGGRDNIRAHRLTEKVIKELEKNFPNSIPKVEQIQDFVVKVLLDEGHLKTARAYENYRSSHAEERKKKREALFEKIERKEAEMMKLDGTVEKFDLKKMINEVYACAQDLNKVDCDALVKEAVSYLYEGIHEKELTKSLINAARSKIETNAQYSFLAARLLCKDLYRKILNTTPENDEGKFKDIYRKGFTNYLKEGVENGLVDPKLLDFDLTKISAALFPKRDYEFHYRGLQTVVDRYLLRNNSTKTGVFELPQYFWMRVAMGLCIAEKEQKEMRAISFYHLMSEMIYIPSTPTLFNAGTTHAQLSSCFLNTVEDSLEGIFKSFTDNAKLSKYAGGLGTDWTNVRSLGSTIKGTNGVSQGVIPFLKIFNDVALAVNQGGKRKGAMCAYLEVWHGDVEEFLEAKKNTGDEKRRLHDVHTALWVPDLFMKRVQENGKWTLFSPAEVPTLHDLYGAAFEQKYAEFEAMNLPSAKVLDATSLWRKILTMTFETGHPWITFKDPCNLRNPQDHCGVIHNSNLCTEITLNNSKGEIAVCNIGSLNISKFVLRHDGIDDQLLKKSVFTAMRMLDNVIDINYYPTEEARHANLLHRPVGIGVMGYQDALFQLQIPFASEEHLDFADNLMEKISYYAIEASSDLSLERGAYQTFPGSKWDRGIFPLDSLELLRQSRGGNLDFDSSSTMDWDALKVKVKKQGLRNSNCMAIAPTATISNIAGVYPCIEPAFRNIYVKENTDGSFIVVNQYLVEELEKLEMWDSSLLAKIKLNNGSIQNLEEIPLALRKRYKETFEIPTEWILKAAARRGKWIDQSQSVNIFLARPSGKEVSNIYFLAWSLGLKTTYYLRTLGSSQVTKTNEDQITQDQITQNQKGMATVPSVLNVATQAGGFDSAPKITTRENKVHEHKGSENIENKESGNQARAPIHAESTTEVKKQENEKSGNSGADALLNAKLCLIDDPDCEACQ